MKNESAKLVSLITVKVCKQLPHISEGHELPSNVTHLRYPNDHLLFRNEHIVTACKRSLGQGNVFTPVCHSVHRVGGVVYPIACWDIPPRQTHPSPPDTTRYGQQAECILVIVKNLLLLQFCGLI